MQGKSKKDRETIAKGCGRKPFKKQESSIWQKQSECSFLSIYFLNKNLTPKWLHEPILFLSHRIK